MTLDGQHCSFVLLSEFDIDLGPKLTYQFPQPLGIDGTLLANLMLPDGAEKQLEDWTIFFLNQTSFNTIAPVLALETSDQRRFSAATDDEGKPELLYVLNLVRTKHDKAVKRGAVVKAMAICTRHPFIQIFKPVLLMALDDYFSDPSQDCLARLFDAINSMDLSAAPVLSRHEKLIMRTSDRKDLFAEKFAQNRGFVSDAASTAETLAVPVANTLQKSGSSTSLVPKSHRSTVSWDSRTSIEDGIVMGREKARDRAGTESDATRPIPRAPSPVPKGDSFSLDGSAVWVDGDSTMEATPQAPAAPAQPGVSRRSTLVRGRRSTDASSSSDGRKDDYFGGGSVPTMNMFGASTPNLVKDTRAFQTFIAYKGHQLPIKMPVDTFPEEVGDYSLIQLITTFTSSTASVQGPLHPHLHSNGSLTPPIIILFNALITGKRMIFLGHNRPAGQVSSHVLAACALASGCGSVLRGYTERTFPYANLLNKEEWEIVPGYIAGVTNPIFESFDTWDILCDISTGRIVVFRDIMANHPPTAPALSGHANLARSGTVKAEASIPNEEELGRIPAGGAAPRGDYVAKADSTDNLFIEDIISAIHYHFGENLVRARFQEYVVRFVRIASRYEEEVRGQTSIGFPSTMYSNGHLGSGIVFVDEHTGQKELVANAHRIEAWMKTDIYTNFQADFNKSLTTTSLEGFDVAHQLWRLRHARNMKDGEVELILRTLASKITSYVPVVELLSHMSSHQQGLLPLSFGLFHQEERIRELTVDIFNELRNYSIGVHFLHGLNHFQRFAFVRQAAQREARVIRMQQHQQQHQQQQQDAASPYNNQLLPNHSESSLV